MKKIFEQPELRVFHIGKEIRTDIIVVSNGAYGAGGGEKVYAPGRDFDSWNEGF